MKNKKRFSRLAMLVKWGLTQACRNIFKTNWKLNHWHFRNDIQIYHLKLHFYFLLKHRSDLNIPMKKNLTWITWSSNLTRSLGLGIFSVNSLRKTGLCSRESLHSQVLQQKENISNVVVISWFTIKFKGNNE